MKNSGLRIVIFAVLLLAVLMGYNNCGKPSARYVQPSNERALTAQPLESTSMEEPVRPTSMVASALTEALCNEIAGCYGDVNKNECLKAVTQSSAMVGIVGLKGYDDFAAVAKAESEGLLFGDITQLSICVEAVLELSCDAASIQTGYDFDNANPFANIHLLLADEPSCFAIFQ